MPYDGKLLARAREALERQNRDNKLEQARRIEAMHERCPELKSIELAMTRQMVELARLAFSHDRALPEKLDQLRRDNLELQARRAELLVGLGKPIDYLDEIISCPICRDSGVHEGKPCVCLKKLYNRELTKELSRLLQHGDESFERFDLSLYDGTPGQNGAPSPRETMQMVYKSCRKFADSFPDTSANLLFQGGTGLGKTFLSACIARVVADKGCSVCYEAAATATEAFETQKFSRDPDASEAAAQRVRWMLDCDLLILDDLGTEFSTAVSTAALYSLVNGRLVAGKPSIISTNLTDEELQKRYSPQIFSRLHGEYHRLPFVGRDLRQRGKK